MRGSQKASALDSVIAKIPALNTLEEVEKNILKDPLFFNLRDEIATIPNHGKTFLDLYEGDVAAGIRPIVETELTRIVDEAGRQKTAIDDYFDPMKKKAPTTQSELDATAKILDGLLGGSDLAQYARTRGINRVEVERLRAVEKILNDKIKPGGGPPVAAVSDQIQLAISNVTNILITPPIPTENCSHEDSPECYRL